MGKALKSLMSDIFVRALNIDQNPNCNNATKCLKPKINAFLHSVILLLNNFILLKQYTALITLFYVNVFRTAKCKR